MTRKEAIEVIKDIYNYTKWDTYTTNEARMTREEKELALYCLKASSDYHSEVCEECIKYPNCDHTRQDDVTETIIKALEQEPICPSHGIDCEDCPVYEPRVDAIIRAEVKRIVDEIPEWCTGNWLETNSDDSCWYMCSECHRRTDDKSDYCPNCGARMIKSQE